MWFFIRYSDPDYHLRIRLHVNKQEDLGTVILKLRDELLRDFDIGVINKIETGTYIREIERYGASSILAIEEIFYNDSEFVAKSIKLIEEEDELALFVLKGIDRLLDDFQYSLTQKLNILKNCSYAFHKEFKSDLNLKKALQKKFKKLNLGFTELMKMDFQSENNRKLNLLLNERSERNSRLCAIINTLEKKKQLKIPKEEIMYSLIHMHINRIFRAQQRKYELVLYDLLYQYYKSLKYIQQDNI